MIICNWIRPTKLIHYWKINCSIKLYVWILVVVFALFKWTMCVRVLEQTKIERDKKNILKPIEQNRYANESKYEINCLGNNTWSNIHRSILFCHVFRQPAFFSIFPNHNANIRMNFLFFQLICVRMFKSHKFC